MELPDAPTKKCVEELQQRKLLNSSVTPKGNQTVLWVWRGSLKGDLGGQGGLGEHGKGLNLVQPCVILTDDHS